jgi:hypothetical protein
VVVAFVHLISSEANNFGLGAVLFHLFSELENHLYWESNPGQFVSLVIFVPVIYLEKTAVLLVPFFFIA